MRRPVALSGHKVPIPADVGVRTPRKGPLRFGSLHDVFHHTAESWFGPHTPRHLPLWVLDLMRMDETIALAMRARRAVLSSADYRVECRESEEVRQFAQDLLDDNKFRLLWQGLLALEFGFVAIEIVWAVRDMTIRTVTPEGPQQVTIRNAFVIDELRGLDPHETEIQVDDLGDYAGIAFGSDLSGGRVVVPPARSVLYTHQMEFGNLIGRSGMGPAFLPWFHSNTIKEGMARFFEQKGNPPLIGRAPDTEDLSSLQKTTDTASYVDPIEYMNTVLLNLRSGGVLTMPSTTMRDDAGSPTSMPLFDVQVLDAPGRQDEFVGALAYLDNLKVRGCLGNDLVVLIGSPGQAGAKQGGRLFHEALRPDQMEWSHQTLRQVIMPAVRANFGPDAPRCRIIPGLIAENKAELFVDLAKALADATQVLPDGRQFKAAQSLNIHKMLEEIGMPVHDVDVVAKEPQPVPDEFRRPEGRPTSDTGEDGRFDSDDRVRDLERRVDLAMATRTGGPGDTHVHLPDSLEARLEFEQRPPVVNVTVPAPVVNVSVPPQAPPVVNIPQQAPPVVNVEIPRPKPRKVRVRRNAEGLMELFEVE